MNGTNRLKLPPNVEDLGLQYMQATVSMEKHVARLVEIMENVDSHLSILALYLERKGISENLISEDDVDSGDDPVLTPEKP